MAEQTSNSASTAATAAGSGASSSFWDRASKWASENKLLVVGGVVLIVAGGGAFYYVASSKPDDGTGDAKKSKKERRKAKQEAREAAQREEPQQIPSTEPKPAAVAAEPEEDIPEVDESIVETLSEQERKDYAARLKAAGNKAYGSKDYNRAIELYGKAILCKPDPIFYSNRAACYNALSNWDKVVEDTTAAIALDNEYVKALNRRANAYEQLGKYSESLLDYTASCIIDAFRNDQSAQSVERLLKKVAESKAKDIMLTKEKKLPSSMFVTNYLQSFRVKPIPAGLEETAELPEDSGRYQMRKGLLAMMKKTADGYDEASDSFNRALEQEQDLGPHKAYAHNLRGTFRYLKGDNEAALEDLTQSAELDPSLTQSYIKRASMHLEQGSKELASLDFEQALAQNKDDPDIYYHRAQLHFILGEFAEAAKDYQKSIDIDGEFIFSHIQLGVTQYKMGSIASSMATFRRCRKRFPDVADVFNYYGELLLDQQKYQEAIEQFDQAVEIEKKTKPLGMNVLPLINKALAVFQWKQEFAQAEDLCQKALIIDPECDIAVATMAQLLLQQGKVPEALIYFERAAELSRTEGEIVNALSYAEATRTQLEVQEKYPKLASRLQSAGIGPGAAPGGLK